MEAWVDRVFPFIQCHQEPRGVVRWLTPGQARKAAELMPAYIAPVFLFALATGLRMRNITHLELEEIDLEKRKTVVGKTKNGDSLAVPLNDMAIEVLWGIDGREGRVFRNQYGKPFDNANTPAFRAALRAAGIERFRFHDTRHTWASWMVQSGVTERELMELGGWKVGSMVRRYAHLAPHQLTKAAEAIDRVMAQSRHSADQADKITA